MRLLIGSKYKLVVVTLLIIATFTIVNSLHFTSDDKLKVAYTEDLAGIVINSIAEKARLSKISSDFEYLNIGDCCGSNAQFALANNKVDLVVMCPDALEYLKNIKDDYVELGVILYDSDVVISGKDDADISVIGYMNKRELQKKALIMKYQNVNIVPMFPSAIPYALSNNKIDAAVVDVNNYLVLDYEGTNLTKNEPTQILVANKKVLDDYRLQEFLEAYNSEIEKINQDEDYIIQIIEKNLNVKGIKEKWEKAKVKFGAIQR